MQSDHIVVDTDIFIWLVRGKKHAATYGPFVEGKRIVLSFATVAELWRGAYRNGYNEKSRKRLEADIDIAVVVQPTSAITHTWAQITDQARADGHALGQKAQAHDAWVAATALHFKLSLLTGNRKHFEGIPGLKLVDVPEIE